VEQVALERPTLFVFEDIHWADNAQLDLLEYLATHVRGAPAVFLALARSELLEVRPSWGSGVLGHTTIPLEPLSPVDAASIASYLLSGGGDLSSVERLVAVAEGNPLFIEELAASLLERGPSDELPMTVRRAIASRIDALPPDLERPSWRRRWSGRTSGAASSERSPIWRRSTRHWTRSNRGT
jgi:hypothetical protein